MDVRFAVPLLLAVAGCELGFGDAPMDAFLPDDDDSSRDGADDDDSSSDDDDAVEIPRRVVGVHAEVRDTAGESWWSEVTFRTDPGGVFEEYGRRDAGPVPGISLHPELLVATETECVLLSSTEPPDSLQQTDEVGGLSTWSSPPEASRTLQIEQGLYAGAGEGPLPDSAVWDLEIKGGNDWGAGALGLALASPAFVEGILPSAGTLGSIDEVHFTWTPGDSEDGIELLLVRFDGIDPSAWKAVRCSGLDVGEVRVRAGPLAVGAGPIVVYASRADWAVGAAEDGAPRTDLGFVRSLRYELQLAR